MSIVENVRVYDLDECLIAAGYSMSTKTADYSNGAGEKDHNRAQRLIHASEVDNDAHIQFMSGIRVSFDVTFTIKAWTEAERYRFLEFVSSQSTLHRITKMDLDSVYNEYVDPVMIKRMKELVEDYNNEPSQEKKLRIVYSNPNGMKLTARMTTNYRCLRNVYKQRKNHQLPEWREFCHWIETLPYAHELITGDIIAEEKANV